jgi:hypothetical protein
MSLEQQVAALVSKTGELTERVVTQADRWDKQVRDEIKRLEEWKQKAKEEYPVINLFSNPGLSTDEKGHVRGIIVGYNAAMALISIKSEADSNSAWWQSGGRRLRIAVKANSAKNGVNCCGNWYCALRLSNHPTSIPTNAAGVPLTYTFDYKVIKRTSSKGRIRIGWEQGKDIDSTPDSKWKKAYYVYTHPAQRLYFISFYPGEPNAEIEILLRNLVVAPGVTSNRFSNYVLKEG